MDSSSKPRETAAHETVPKERTVQRVPGRCLRLPDIGHRFVYYYIVVRPACQPISRSPAETHHQLFLLGASAAWMQLDK